MSCTISLLLPYLVRMTVLVGWKSHKAVKKVTEQPHRLGVAWSHPRPSELVALRRAWTEMLAARDTCNAFDMELIQIHKMVSSVFGQEADEKPQQNGYVSADIPIVLLILHSFNVNICSCAPPSSKSSCMLPYHVRRLVFSPANLSQSCARIFSRFAISLPQRTS